MTAARISPCLSLTTKLTERGDIVLDPFAGSGSTLLAAKILGRRYIGIELDAEYVKAATSQY